MSKNYYVIAIQRYFSITPSFLLLASILLLVYGYYEDDVCFWIGLVATVAILAISHIAVSLYVRMFGDFATKRQVKYVMDVISLGKALSPEECETIKSYMIEGGAGSVGCVDDYILKVNCMLEAKAKNGDAEANYWLGMYQHLVCEEENHNSVALELIERSAEMGCEKAKNVLKKARKWT